MLLTLILILSLLSLVLNAVTLSAVRTSHAQDRAYETKLGRGFLLQAQFFAAFRKELLGALTDSDLQRRIDAQWIVNEVRRVADHLGVCDAEPSEADKAFAEIVNGEEFRKVIEELAAEEDSEPLTE